MKSVPIPPEEEFAFLDESRRRNYLEEGITHLIALMITLPLCCLLTLGTWWVGESLGGLIPFIGVAIVWGGRVLAGGWMLTLVILLSVCAAQSLFNFLNYFRATAGASPLKLPTWPRVWGLFQYLLPRKIRERVYVPALNDLLQDYFETKSKYRGRWAKSWLTFCYTFRTLLLMLDSARAVASDSAVSWIICTFRKG